jgi:hypothetical protein
MGYYTRAFGEPGSMSPPFKTHITTYPTVMMQQVRRTGRYIFIYRSMFSRPTFENQFGVTLVP